MIGTHAKARVSRHRGTPETERRQVGIEPGKPPATGRDRTKGDVHHLIEEMLHCLPVLPPPLLHARVAASLA